RIGPNSSGLGQVFWYTLTRTHDAQEASSKMELRTIQDWIVRPILRTARGVDDVLSWGGEERQYQVVIDPLRLLKYGLSYRDVIEAIDANNRQVGGQHVNLGSEQYVVRGLGLVGDEEDLGRIVLEVADGTPVYLRDVARIEQGPAPRV